MNWESARVNMPFTESEYPGICCFLKGENFCTTSSGPTGPKITLEFKVVLPVLRKVADGLYWTLEKA